MTMIKDRNHKIDISFSTAIAAIICLIPLSFWFGYKLQERLLQEQQSVAFTQQQFYSNHFSRTTIEYFHPQLPTLVYSCPSCGLEARQESQIESIDAKDFIDSNTCSNKDVTNKCEHVPAFAWHLKVDKHSSQPLVLSNDDLSKILQKIAIQNSWTLLSSQCINSNVIMCIGTLIHGYISIYVWSDEGSIIVDIFANEDFDFLTMMEKFQDYFDLRKNDDIKLQIEKDANDNNLHEISTVSWSHRIRGFEIQSRKMTRNDDLKAILASFKIIQKHVASTQTQHQRFDIYDITYPQFTKNGRHTMPTSNEKKDRITFSNGILISNRYGQVEYYEGLVHPAMFTHPDPTYVAILGGGDGSVVRELSKHQSIQKLVVLESDETFLNFSSQYLPYENECSITDSDSCMDDGRVEIHDVDAIEWIISQYGEDNERTSALTFDVIIMDFFSLNFDENQYDEFSESVYNALGDEGILVCSIGSVDSDELPSTYMRNSSFVFIDSLIDAHFKSIVQYEDSRTQRGMPLKFVIAMKSKSLLSHWMASEAEINLLIQTRLIASSSLHYFDSATMQSFQFPSRILEDQWCKENADECERQHGFDPEKVGYDRTSFEVSNSKFAKGGRGVLAIEEIPSGSYIGANECVNGMYVPPSTLSLIVLAEQSFPEHDYLKCISTGYVDGYGWYDNDRGPTSAGVDPGIFTFVNHGCNGTSNMGTDDFIGTEMTIDTNAIHPSVLEFDVINPFIDRHFPNFECYKHVAKRDIQPGEELLDDYLSMGGAIYWADNIHELRHVCSGFAGTVSNYEEEKS